MRPFIARLSALPLLSALLLSAGCQDRVPVSTKTLPQARQGFVTHLLVQKKTPEGVVPPPPGYELVQYAAPLGNFPAYVATVPGGQRHPAIVWLAGGFDNSIDDTPWAPATPDNDQSAHAFPAAGIVTMYPSLRGGNNNPGYIEGLYGEVDDALAAARYLASRPDVDPSRIYLGGHSTGGTLALLVAESSSMFRAVFSFGPVASVGHYSPEDLPFNSNDDKELVVRAPMLYLNSITSPTFVFEGTGMPSNTDQLHKLVGYSSNPLVHFYDLPYRTHFSELAPITPIVAHVAAADSGPTVRIDFAPFADNLVPVTH